MLKQRFQLLLLTTSVLSVFYPSIFAEFNSLDDVPMVTSLLNMEHWKLKDIFIPGEGGGLYYRPLLFLSFVLDKELWFMQGSFLHLENILLHLFSSILVYCLALYLLPESKKETSYLPLVAALCFGLHPISTEPVSWVSGRTDVMAGTFVLLSAVTLLKFKLEQKKGFLLISIFALLLGMLTKEVALAFLPGAFFILIAQSPIEKAGEVTSEERFWYVGKILLLFIAIGAGSALLFFLLRSHAFTSNSSRIGMTLKFIFNDLDQALFVFFKAFGFYMKKIYWPFPLNFAIVEVDPLYELLAIPIVLLSLLIAARRTLLSATFIAGVFMLTPSFLIAFNQVAWTPYAERYAYIASAFFIIVTVLSLGQWLEQYNYVMMVKTGVTCLLVLAALATLQRNLIWKTSLTLYADTVNKSPEFSKAWNEYGVAYYKKKDLRNAEISFAKASSLYSLYYDEKSDLNLAQVLFEQGKQTEAAEVYERVLNKGGDRSGIVLEHYIEFLEKKVATEKRSAEVLEIRREMLKYSEKLYAVNGAPLTLYRMGEISNGLGDRHKAFEYFKKAYDIFPQEDKYKAYAKRAIARLEKE